jgi:hypothetical protein
MTTMVMYRQEPCGHFNLAAPIVQLMPGVSFAPIEMQCWYCRRPVKGVAPTSDMEVAQEMAHRSKLEKLALASHIEITSRRAMKAIW